MYIYTCMRAFLFILLRRSFSSKDAFDRDFSKEKRNNRFRETRYLRRFQQFSFVSLCNMQTETRQESFAIIVWKLLKKRNDIIVHLIPHELHVRIPSRDVQSIIHCQEIFSPFCFDFDSRLILFRTSCVSSLREVTTLTSSNVIFVSSLSQKIVQLQRYYFYRGCAVKFWDASLATYSIIVASNQASPRLEICDCNRTFSSFVVIQL